MRNMKIWQELICLAGVLLCVVSGCKRADEKGPDVQKVMQEAMDKEKNMYQGVQKSMADLEKKVEQQMEKK
jgi:hypothetical protein